MDIRVGSFNGTHFGGGSNLMQMHGDFEGLISLLKKCIVWVGVIDPGIRERVLFLFF